MAIQRYPQEWSEWGEWLSRGLHGRCRHRLAILLAGVLFAQGRRTVASWLRAAGITDEFKAYYYFISSVGRNTRWIAWRLLCLVFSRPHRAAGGVRSRRHPDQAVRPAGGRRRHS